MRIGIYFDSRSGLIAGAPESHDDMCFANPDSANLAFCSIYQVENMLT
jgi:hypothetical protein